MGGEGGEARRVGYRGVVWIEVQVGIRKLDRRRRSRIRRRERMRMGRRRRIAMMILLKMEVPVLRGAVEEDVEGVEVDLGEEESVERNVEAVVADDQG